MSEKKPYFMQFMQKITFQDALKLISVQIKNTQLSDKKLLKNIILKQLNCYRSSELPIPL